MIKVDKYVKGLKVVRGPDWYYSDQDGGAGNVGVVTKLQSSTGYVQVIWSNGRDDNYRIGSNGKYDLALANEADAHLLGHSTSSEPTVESLKAMFPPGTKFIPINETTEYKVYKSWKFDVNSRGDYCFINSNDYYAHNGYLYEKSTGKYAEIVTPTETLALPSSIIASKIPKEGAVHIAHFSDTELEALLKVIVSRIGLHHSDKTRTSEHKHLAWTQNSYWYTINTTSKTFYPRSQFFDEPVEALKVTIADIEAKFPVGTVFKPISGKKDSPAKRYEELTVKKGWKIIERYSGVFEFQDHLGGCLHNGYVYAADVDRWAEIVTVADTSPEFNVGDKVILIDSGSPLLGQVGVVQSQGNNYLNLEGIVRGTSLCVHKNNLIPYKQEHVPYKIGDTLTAKDGDIFKVGSVKWKDLNLPNQSKGIKGLKTWYYFDESGLTGYPHYYVSNVESKKQPVEEELLKGNDIVIFDGPNGPRKYTVNWTCLSFPGIDNDIIFKDLGVDKYQLASKMYGYSVYTGDWPSFNTKDYKAATNLVNELHRLCAEAKSSAPTQSNSKTTISYEQEKHPSARSISFQPKSVILQGDDIKISRVQAVRASGVRCSAGEIKCRSGHSY